MAEEPIYYTLRSREPTQPFGARNAGPAGSQQKDDMQPRPATHDISRTSFHVKHISQFAKRLEDSAVRAFPNRGHSTQRYKSVQSLILHWGSDDLFVLPEVEDLERCLREDYAFNTDIFAIPSENAHLELMMRVGQLIKEYESPDTLFIVYYGGHARIDESRQSTWCATRQSSSPWLQWSAIQTLLERSKSDVLILLDCCAGAASATFPTGNSITETISASSWDAIAPDPGRYSFTNVLIEVLAEWRVRAFSVAMLHAEVLARLKHPRPITINGKHFEARSTPVHFMMTANHKAPSIEISRTGHRDMTRPTSSHDSPDVEDAASRVAAGIGARGPDSSADAVMNSEPNEDTPHVMISLALEDDQRLDINAWEQWLNAFPALAKYVTVQGVFKSHSTLLLMSMPIMIWDMLPEDHAIAFVAFIRSNNLAMKQKESPPAIQVPHQIGAIRQLRSDAVSFISGGTTVTPTENTGQSPFPWSASEGPSQRTYNTRTVDVVGRPSWNQRISPEMGIPTSTSLPLRYRASQATMSSAIQQSSPQAMSGSNISRQMIINQQQAMRRTTFGKDAPPVKKFSSHIEARLEGYYQRQPFPNDGELAMLASNLGIEPVHIGIWYHHRRERYNIEGLQAQEGSSPPSSLFTTKILVPSEFLQILDQSGMDDALIFDLRPSEAYQESHVNGAINLQVPQWFLQQAPLDLVQRTVGPDAGQERFYKWRDARRAIFYSTHLEVESDCPTALEMHRSLASYGWIGECFFVRGRYEEFRNLIQKHTVDTDKRKGLKHSNFELQASISPSSKSVQRSDPRQTEEELEREFYAKHGDLILKARELRAEAHTAGMLDAFDRGLQKMRHEQQSSPLLSGVSTNPEKQTKGAYFDQDRAEHDESNEYVKVQKGYQDDVAEQKLSGGEYVTDAYDTQMRNSGRGTLLTKMFRRT